MNKNSLLDKLTLVEHLAKASKIKRFLKSPFHYICAIGFRDLIYPMTRKGIIQKKNTFFGMPMQIILPSSTDIYLTGGKSHDSEIRLAKFLIHNLNTGDIFVDVGAHFGYFTLLASKLVGTTGNVFAFEASKNTYEILASNTQYYNNINTYNNLITNRGGVIYLLLRISSFIFRI